ncbi:ferredoxin [Nocardia arthritidis]|uniref:Ferredoxin n=1 Tax=Nocardia arthritidis TaxID=228602 RepID=A0A6G9YQJ8_9NOCA|nr:ferredoxin [Nocardia arthritidis]QIS15494.1 ferredoxin [Nocardia arthritidis]
MKITVDRTLCVGSGMCALTAPTVFDQDEVDGTVRLLDPSPGEAHHAAAREAEESCPAAAIRISNGNP